MPNANYRTTIGFTICLDRHGRLGLPVLAIGALLDRPPLETQTSDKSASSASEGNIEGITETLHVRLKNSVEGIQTAHLLQGVLNLRGSNVDENGRINANVVSLECVDEAVLEDSLSNSDEQSSTESLEELHTSGTDGNPVLGQYSLNNEDTDLEARSDTQASDDLVTEPLFEGRVDIKSCEHAAADSVKDHARDDDIVVVTNGGNQASCNDRAKNGSKEERENLNSSLDGTNTLDSLEVESFKMSAKRSRS
jgi:hypothetical protein